MVKQATSCTECHVGAGIENFQVKPCDRIVDCDPSVVIAATQVYAFIKPISRRSILADST